MKKSFSTLLVLLPFIALSQKHKIEMNLEEGDRFEVISTVHQDIRQSVMGMDQVMVSDQNYDYTFVVTDADKKTIMSTLTFDRIAKMDSNNISGSSQFDSDWPDTSSLPMHKAFRAMLESQVQLQFSRSGEILEVSGVDGMVDNMMNAVLKDLPEVDPSTIRSSMSNMISDETMKKQLSSLSQFPSYAVGVGDSWSEEVEMKSLITLITETEYTVTAIDDEYIYVDINGTLESPGDDVTETNGMSMKYHLEGTQVGKLIIQKSNGWMKRSEIVQDVEGTVEILPNESMPNGMSWPIYMDSEILFETK